MTDATQEKHAQPGQFRPAPGRYEGVDEAVYHEDWLAANASTLGNLKRSPAFCRWTMDHPKASTPAMAFGKATHCAILEPERFDTAYHVDPPCPPDRKEAGWRNTKIYKEERALLELDGFEVIKQEEMDAARFIADQMRKTPSKARDILENMTGAEVSYVAKDSATGLLCKVRPDIEVAGAQMAVDLKTTRDASAWAFARAVHTYGYHRSKPFYLDTMNAEGSAKWDLYLFLVVENTAPYEFAVYDLDPYATDLGRREVDALKKLYQECEASGEWPGYSTEIQTVGVPEYAYYQEESDTL